MATPAQPNTFNHYRALEPTQILVGKTNTKSFDYFKASEPIIGLALIGFSRPYALVSIGT